MSLLNSVINAVNTYAKGPHHYIRTVTVTGGNSELGIAGTPTIVDTPISIPVISFVDVYEKEMLVRPDYAMVRKHFIIFFDTTITESLVNNANGILVGGTYDEDTHVVTGGIFYLFDHTTETLQYLDSDTACGINIKGTCKA